MTLPLGFYSAAVVKVMSLHEHQSFCQDIHAI